MKDHLLNAGELKIGWPFLFHKRRQSHSTDRLRFHPYHPVTVQITREKRKGYSWHKTVWRSKHLDYLGPDYRRTTVFDLYRAKQSKHLVTVQVTHLAKQAYTSFYI